MKKFLLALVLMTSTITALAQSALNLKDEMIGNVRVVSAYYQSRNTYLHTGERKLGVGYYPSIEDGVDFNIKPELNLQIMDFKGQLYPRYALVFEVNKTGDYTINEGCKLAIKLNNDEIIILASEGDCRVKNYEALSAYQYSSTPMYVIADSDLDKIINVGASKIRLAINGKTFDFEFENNQFSNFIKEALPKVNDAAKADPMTKDL